MMTIVAPILCLAVASAGQPSTDRLTLEEALAIARARQPDLRRARSDAIAARARSRQALAGLLPQLSGVAQYQRTTANFAARPGTIPPGLLGTQASTFETFNFFSAGITASQLIYDFGRTWDQLGSAEALARASESTRQATAVIVARQVRVAFFDARAARALVRVAAESLDNQQRHMAQIQGFVEVGTRPEIDLAQARTDLANARLQLINANNTYATARAELARTLGVDRTLSVEVADDGMPALPEESLGAEALIHIALSSRPEVAALQQQIRAQSLTLSSVEGSYGPQISASTSFTEAGSELDALAWNWDVTVAMTWALYEGGRTRAQAREASANLERAHAELASLRLSVRVEVERARLAILAAKASAIASAEAAESAMERLRLAEGRYETGVGDVIELGDARLALANAKAQQVQTEYDLSSARATLLSTLGQP